MPRIVVVDTYYDAFLRNLPPLQKSYDEELRALLDRGFGTFDAYSHNLKPYGWEVLDIVANYEPLQRLWARENDQSDIATTWAVTLKQLERFQPDVVFMQDLSYFPPPFFRQLKKRGWLLAGQCSCPLPDPEHVAEFEILFSSFPHHVRTFREMGVQAEYLPLAFDPRMWTEETFYGERDIDIAFVGGLGRSSHWKAGTDALEQVARVFGQRFQWRGYGRDNVDNSSPLAKCYRGQAWGKEMYAIYGRSKIVVNRHGEVAQGWANNLRMYEATGMGALLMTEAAPNLERMFPADAIVTYANPDELCTRISYFLDRDGAQAIARKGQQWTLAYHNYAQRMATVSEYLKRALEKKHVNVLA